MKNNRSIYNNAVLSPKDRAKELSALPAEYHDNARLSAITDTYSPETAEDN
jgi:hypothetical protein